MTTPQAPATEDTEALVDPPAPSPTPDPPAPELSQEPPTAPQTPQMPEPGTTFTMPELPGITFTVIRGGLNDEGKTNPANWIAITGADDDGNMVFRAGFAGP
ncbi:hypothetical protein [Mycobacteroides abscessus]|uniref:hypothetical protein n=1 Tax=Mycobacteroides abscessus TaxID=36809 RepID=UPI00092C469B|nr:hypothetical protein [Mycobacteroides abscessus]SHT35504.1 Uncharacterised protein [Mycobacteroides abscessus subsp. abscessus]SHU67152.1 Uncharacterised protein [Mycobacteroides abscessus subsp. abscessus]SIN52012.1 Uncharacterised protein [Mycobacteroides abscessus subsp. abscessus]SLH17673.1 Uncharacterised protein [Mycobacteroides abscessus subsp. abscessus]